MGLHVHPLLPVGQLAYCLGNALARTSFFDIKIDGKGGHAAFPELTIDPIYIASHFILGAQGIISRYTPANESKVISFTNFIIGEKEGVSDVTKLPNAENVIPPTVTLSGTIRTLDEKVYDTIKQKLLNLAKGFEESFGAEITIAYTLEVPCLFNSSSIHEKLKPVLVDCFGEDNIIQVKPLLGGEDFAFIANKIPSMFYFLGANDGTNKFFIHDPRVIFDENCIKYGSQFLAQSAIRLLEEFSRHT